LLDEGVVNNAQQVNNGIIAGVFFWPTTGKVSSNFGVRDDPWGRGDSTRHFGIDITNTSGTRVWAVREGRVIAVKHEKNRLEGKLYYN
jgi:murein DD-endopeptidase MepM/ murein hydrolase activator NlpD